ncbi:MAG: RsiV family protein [Spirochaetaceae bacterium]|jgi:hypothetical protein|nr:RsiV family protein [Spirochaetaceae bacterium]
MKLHFLKKQRLCLALAVSLIWISCAGGKDAPKTDSRAQTAPYPLVTVNSSIALSPEQGETGPRIALSLSLLDSAEDEPLQELLYAGVSPQEYADNLVQTYRNFYQEILAITENVSEPPSPAFDWNYREVHGIRVYPQLLIIDRTKEYYTGGAHGMVETDYFLIDSTEKKQLHLRDLFQDGTAGALQERVEAALRVYSGLEEGAPLSNGYYFNDSAEPPDNFYLTPQGLTFHWNPYEIAPYSVGPVEITVPYADVEELFNSLGKSLKSQIN